MPIVKPFRGLRPVENRAKDVASPPYDVLNSDEARALVKNNPDSFLRVNKPEVDFPADTNLYSDDVYKKGLENLNRLIDEKIMIRDDKPCFYLYKLTWQNQSQIGIVAVTSVDDYNNGLIKKHEHTRPVKVDDRANHIIALNAQVGPVFSIFKNNVELRKIFNEISATAPNVDFTAEDSVTHTMWIISNPEQTTMITNIFSEMSEIYIADGHHRSEAAAEVKKRFKAKDSDISGEKPSDYFLNVLFPDDEVRILPYNRVIKDLNGKSEEIFLGEISEFFDVKKIDLNDLPTDSHIIGMYLNKNWYQLTPKANIFDPNHPVDQIDAEILYKNLLKPILGIEDIRTDKRIDFIGGIRGNEELIKLVDSAKWEVAFALPPVTVGQLLQVADANTVMPPKSTWFEPKLRSGMVINLLDK